jgi:hypothetical protein
MQDDGLTGQYLRFGVANELQDEQEVLNGERYNVGLSASTNAK